MFLPAARSVNNFHLPFMLAALLSFIFSGAEARAQSGIDISGTGGNHIIQGRIFFPSGRQVDQSIRVKLESPAIGEHSVFSDRNGAFSFRNLAGGSYTITIEGTEDYEGVREPVYIDQPQARTRGGVVNLSTPRIFNVPIYLVPKRTRTSGPGPGVINAALAGVPKPAVDLFMKAAEAARAGDNQKAIDNLKAAISVYPEFAIAHNELGVLYLKMGQPDRAAESLRSSLKITPNSLEPQLNYGIALLEKKDFPQAETELRKAIKINDAVPTAHMYLGLTLISLKRYDDAEKELERAVALKGGENLAMAHKYLGGLYWKSNKYKQAAAELEIYLKLVPQAPDGEKIRETIKELRSKK
jgi:tetratricopeptide (TPR) repeat protein